jgi:hypothetical protein
MRAFGYPVKMTYRSAPLDSHRNKFRARRQAMTFFMKRCRVNFGAGSAVRTSRHPHLGANTNRPDGAK